MSETLMKHLRHANGATAFSMNRYEREMWSLAKDGFGLKHTLLFRFTEEINAELIGLLGDYGQT